MIVVVTKNLTRNLKMIRNVIVLIALGLITFTFTGCGQTKIEDELLDELGFCFAFDLKCGEENDDKFDAIQQRLNQLEAIAFMNRELIMLNGDSDYALSNIVLDLQSEVNALSNQETISNDAILTLQNAISDLQAATSQGIAEVIDPCGDEPGEFDEVIIKLADGSFIAYFQQGSKRFLTSLGEGNFITTDSQRCRFIIANGELVD